MYDAFICHASEDKADVARPLAETLRESHIAVWYDDFSLEPGDSLRQAIDFGLSRSRFGIVIFSPSFFLKRWSQWELGGLVQRENAGSQKVILPVWHKVTHRDIAAASPTLADLVAIPTDAGIENVADRLLKVLRPEGSTLIIARDLLIRYGLDPPAITDDWWLDMAEASASNPVEDTFQEAMGWGHWGFPLPPKSRSAEERGLRLAWAAMQHHWQNEAKEKKISQVTNPKSVCDFIAACPGLRETCHANVPYLIAYAPQLVIRGCGGEFEAEIQEFYDGSVQRNAAQRARNDRSGTALTIDGCHPLCDELFALRHPTFGGLQPDVVACNFVQGDINGPEVRVYDQIDYIAWLLSNADGWLPRRVRRFLIQGMIEWAVWVSDVDRSVMRELDGAIGQQRFHLSTAGRQQLAAGFSRSAQLLSLPESGTELAERFLAAGFAETWMRQARQAREKRTLEKQES